MRSLLGAVAAVLCLAACGGQGAAPPGTTQPKATVAQTKAAATPKTTFSEAEAPEGTLPFGATFTWDDGVQLTVGHPKAFTPSRAAAGTEGFKAFVVYDVTVKNGTGKPLDSIVLSSRATAGDRQSTRVFDRGVDLPTVTVLPGRTLRWREVYGVVKGQPFVVTFSSGFSGARPMFEAAR